VANVGSKRTQDQGSVSLLYSNVVGAEATGVKGPVRYVGQIDKGGSS
jgi:hypothetical protein